VVQNDAANQSAIGTVLVCATTSNLRLAAVGGNVPVRAGDAKLPRDSVIVVTAFVTIDKTRLVEYIGTLRRSQLHQVVQGIHRVIDPI
jgi:mRNA interferase MazF